MENFNIEYSNKNITTPSKQEYTIQLISKVEKLIKRMRWKALIYLEKIDLEEKETYGFKSRNCPPVVDELVDFENDMMKMIKDIKFKKIDNPFQNQLKKDIQEIHSSDKVLIKADKSRNICKMKKEEYEKLLHENITNTYKKSVPSKLEKINTDAQMMQNH